MSRVPTNSRGDFRAIKGCDEQHIKGTFGSCFGENATCKRSATCSQPPTGKGTRAASRQARRDYGISTCKKKNPPRQSETTQHDVLPPVVDRTLTQNLPLRRSAESSTQSTASKQHPELVIGFERRDSHHMKPIGAAPLQQDPTTSANEQRPDIHQWIWNPKYKRYYYRYYDDNGKCTAP
jgi:hypothetical protein